MESGGFSDGACTAVSGYTQPISLSTWKVSLQGSFPQCFQTLIITIWAASGENKHFEWTYTDGAQTPAGIKLQSVLPLQCSPILEQFKKSLHFICLFVEVWACRSFKRRLGWNNIQVVRLYYRFSLLMHKNRYSSGSNRRALASFDSPAACSHRFWLAESLSHEPSWPRRCRKYNLCFS